jgi:toxin ParE1/3/4
MRRYAVVVSAEAERDLDDIASYIAEHDSVARALDVVSRIERRFSALAALPNRGSHPKELLEYGNRDFREVYFKPYRILYRVVASDVVIVLIADGRRDMRTLLARRLLGA